MKKFDKNITLSLTLEGKDADALREWITKQSEGIAGAYKTANERIDELFKNNIILKGTEPEFNIIKNSFMLGYIFGWNDHQELTKD